MALSMFLRSAINGCKVRPALQLSSKYPSMLSAACNRLIHLDKLSQVDNKKVIVLPKEVRQFSTTTPRMAHAGDHSKLWTLERLVSVGILGIFPLGIMFPNVLFDLIMAVSLVMHSHWGLEACAIDYVRPNIFGKLIPKITVVGVYVFSIFLLVALLNLIFNNAGFGNSIRLIWRL